MLAVLPTGATVTQFSRFHGHFPAGPGLAGTRNPVCLHSGFYRAMEMVVTTGAIRCAKLQSKCHHQQTNTSFYRPDALPVAQPTVSEHWREYIQVLWNTIFSARPITMDCKWTEMVGGYWYDDTDDDDTVKFNMNCTFWPGLCSGLF